MQIILDTGGIRYNITLEMISGKQETTNWYKSEKKTTVRNKKGGKRVEERSNVSRSLDEHTDTAGFKETKLEGRHLTTTEVVKARQLLENKNTDTCIWTDWLHCEFLQDTTARLTHNRQLIHNWQLHLMSWCIQTHYITVQVHFNQQHLKLWGAFNDEMDVCNVWALLHLHQPAYQKVNPTSAWRNWAKIVKFF